MRALFVLLAVPVAALANNSEHAAGDESAHLYTAIQQRYEQRASPGTYVPGQAYLAAAQAAAAAPATRGSWTEIGPYHYFTDDPTYADPFFSNTGSGAGY